MKALLTGATGFVGNYVLEFLSSSNIYDEIRVIVRNRSKITSEMRNHSHITILENDLAAMSIDAPFFSGITHVFHIASLASDRASLEDLQQVNVDGTKRLAQAILKYSPAVELFLYISSTGVYGLKLPDKIQIPENYRKHPSSDYQRTKWEAEEYLWNLRASPTNLPLVVLRPPTLMGPKDPLTTPEAVEALKKRKFPIVGNGKNILTMMDVRDLVTAIGVICDHSTSAIGQAYNLYSFRVSLEDYLTSIRSTMGIEIEPKRYPYSLAFMIGLMAEFKDKTLGTKSTRNRYRVRKFGKTRLFDDTKIRQLGFCPKYDFHTSINDTLNWIKQNGK